jgi:hypothetical protein
VIRALAHLVSGLAIKRGGPLMADLGASCAGARRQFPDQPNTKRRIKTLATTPSPLFAIGLVLWQLQGV